MKTVLITGSSSGFGLETAHYFLSKGWKVIATMRNPADSLLQESEQLRILPLDVSDISSIENVVALAGPIDVLVNNMLTAIGINSYSILLCKQTRDHRYCKNCKC